MPPLEELEKRKEELILLFADSEVLKNPERIKALSLEFAQIQRQISQQGAKDEDENDPKKLIMEIRSGTGGGEAALFAGELLSMYQRFAEKKGWRVMVIDDSKTTLGGIKSVALEIQGKDAYSLLRYEAGTHRVQRIPLTEKTGRVHTSTATVTVMPLINQSLIEIKNDDLIIDTAKSSGPGGQNVNKRMTAIRITHKPSGMVVTSQVERSLDQNRQHALVLLKAKLHAIQQEEKMQTTSKERREQIGSGDRSDKIRTYNYPQNRITDHRINKNWHNLAHVIEGNLDDIVSELKENLP